MKHLDDPLYIPLGPLPNAVKALPKPAHICSSSIADSQHIGYYSLAQIAPLVDVLQRLRMSLDPDDWLGEERMLDAIDRAFASSGVAAVAAQPITHIGDSRFEGWYSEQPLSLRCGQHTKQDMRDAYAAGMAEQAAHLSGVKEDGNG